MMPRVRMFMLVSLNFQLVRSIARSYGPDTGISFKMSCAMRSVSITHSAMNRWILRSEELAEASLSNAAASFVYATCCTLQRAHIIMLITLIRARFIDLPKWVLRIRDKSLFCSDLGVCNTLFISFEHTYKITKFRGSSQI